MKTWNIRNESTNNSTTTEITANNPKQSSSWRLQDLSGKLEEAIWSDAQTPNPQKAPLNYIDNMWEWEDAQKKFEEAIAKKQQELGVILWDYDDKIKETDRFREAKTDLEIRMHKVMWVIMDKLEDDDDFILDAYEKLYPGWDVTESVQIKEGENNANSSENDEDVENQDIEAWEYIDEQVNQSWDAENQIGSSVENSLENQGVSFMTLLGDLWFNVKWISVLPLDGMEDGEGNVLEYSSEVLLKFLEILNVKNWDKNKELLSKDEVEKFEQLYAKVKKQCNNYLELGYQIDLLTDKISELEADEAKIYTDYYNWVKEAQKMSDNMDDLNKAYFLNSYLSTKNVSFDSFVSSELVEKQIANIIELNKQWKPIPKTILLYWKPNLWKTYAANVLASELWRKMYHIKSYDIFTGWLSDPNAMLDAIFTWAIKMKEPCIIFLDEIEDFSCGDNWWSYQNLVENTIRHHISKIKDSSLDIMIIWAISNRNKVGSSLMKQDVFSKQIYFTPLSPEKYSKLFKSMLSDKGVKVCEDFNVESLINGIKDLDRDQEYLKKLIDMAIDFHQLNHAEEVDNIVLSSDDFNDAIKFMTDYSHNVSQGVWYNR